MKLQRFDHWAEIGAAGMAAEVVAVESCDGEYYRAADVDALLARIRAAVEAELNCAFDVDALPTSAPDHEVAAAVDAHESSREALHKLLGGSSYPLWPDERLLWGVDGPAALDALLADGGE